MHTLHKTRSIRPAAPARSTTAKRQKPLVQNFLCLAEQVTATVHTTDVCSQQPRSRPTTVAQRTLQAKYCVCKMVVRVDVEPLWLLRNRLRSLLSTKTYGAKLHKNTCSLGGGSEDCDRSKQQPGHKACSYPALSSLWSTSREKHTNFQASQQPPLLFVSKAGVLLLTATLAVARTSPRPTANPNQEGDQHCSPHPANRSRSRLVGEPSNQQHASATKRTKQTGQINGEI